jgi:hypothetical protein
VSCSHRSAILNRGTTGTIHKILNHLDIWVSFDNEVLPFKEVKDVPVDKNGGIPNHQPPILAKSYWLRLASECHDCCHRMTHLMSSYCPNDYRGITFYEPEENIEDNGKDS